MHRMQRSEIRIMKDPNNNEIDKDKFEPSDEDKDFLRRWSTPSSQIAASVRFVTESGYDMSGDELEYLRGKWL